MSKSTKRFLFLLILEVGGSFSLEAHNLILSCPGKEISFKVELAQTPQEHSQGLMFREQMAEDEGMLFLFAEPRQVGMWMKNTPLSLDMIFCDLKGNILEIQENATPNSLDIIGPVEGTARVLEIVAGTVHKHNITKACQLKFAL